MSKETGLALRESLNAVDRIRRRIFALGWLVVVGTLAMYARLEYIHWTSDNVERLLGASVAALTFLIAWVAFAIVLIITRSTKRILVAIELLSRKDDPDARPRAAGG